MLCFSKLLIVAEMLLDFAEILPKFLCLSEVESKLSRKLDIQNIEKKEDDFLTLNYIRKIFRTHASPGRHTGGGRSE